MQIFIHYKTTLHVSGFTAPIIRSIKNCTRSLRYRSYYLYRYFPPTWSDLDWFVRLAKTSPDQTTTRTTCTATPLLRDPIWTGLCDSHKPVQIRPHRRRVAVQVVLPVPEAAGTVFNTPDDGCCDTRNT